MLKKLENGLNLTQRETSDLLILPSTLMICYLNGFEDAKQKLIEAKTILKKLENQDAYIAFKEVMRVLRKMKYN